MHNVNQDPALDARIKRYATEKLAALDAEEENTKRITGFFNAQGIYSFAPNHAPQSRNGAPLKQVPSGGLRVTDHTIELD